MFKYFKKPCFKIKCWSLQVCPRKQADSAKFIKTRQLARQLHLLSLRKLFKVWCAWHLLNSCSTPLICRDLRISELKYDFLGIREYVFRSSFLLTLDILKECFKGRQTVHNLQKLWANSVQANYDRRRSSCPSSSLSLEEIAVYLHRRVLWPSIFLIFIVWMNWRTLQPTIFLVGDWSHVLGFAQLVSHVLGSRALERGTVTTWQVQLGIGVRVQL